MSPDSEFTDVGAGIQYRRQRGTAEMLLARHAESNSLDSAAFTAIGAVLKRVNEDHEVHGLVIRSSARTFCSGGDYTDPAAPGVPSPRYAQAIAECHELLRDRRVPVISVVNGPARAFGCAIALSSELTIAYRDAHFELPELGHGIVPSFAIATLLTRHPMRLIRQLVLTAGPLTADRAFTLGLVSDLVDGPAEANRLVRSYTDMWSTIGPAAIRQAMATMADMESADPDAVAVLARQGVEDQLDRFRRHEVTQTYLNTYDVGVTGTDGGNG